MLRAARTLRAYCIARRLVNPPASCPASAGRLPITYGTAHDKAGAHWLECNLWLLAQIEQLPDPTANAHLEGEYLCRHYAETGAHLAAAHRNFQKAAARCIKAMKRRPVR